MTTLDGEACCYDFISGQLTAEELTEKPGRHTARPGWQLAQTSSRFLGTFGISHGGQASSASLEDTHQSIENPGKYLSVVEGHRAETFLGESDRGTGGCRVEPAVACS